MTATPAAANPTRFSSHRTAHFIESVIREMTRLAITQDFPDFPAPADIKQAAIDADLKQYPL